MPTKKGPGLKGAGILRNGDRLTAKSIAKNTEHLRVQKIPFWSAKNPLYQLTENFVKKEKPLGHNLKSYAESEKHVK